MTNDEPRLRSEVKAQLALQMGRKRLYERGEYELSDWEGFKCPECGWHGLSAPASNDWLSADQPPDDPDFTMCPECERPNPETSDGETAWHRVLEKISEADTDVVFERDDE